MFFPASVHRSSLREINNFGRASVVRIGVEMMFELRRHEAEARRGLNAAALGIGGKIICGWALH